MFVPFRLSNCDDANENAKVFFNSCTAQKGYSGLACLTLKTASHKPVSAPVPVVEGFFEKGKEEEGRLFRVEYAKFVAICVYTPNSGAELQRLGWRIATWDRDFRRFFSSLGLGLGGGMISVIAECAAGFSPSSPWQERVALSIGRFSPLCISTGSARDDPAPSFLRAHEKSSKNPSKIRFVAKQKKPVVALGDFNAAHLDADIWNQNISKAVEKNAGTTPEERASFGIFGGRLILGVVGLNLRGEVLSRVY